MSALLGSLQKTTVQACKYQSLDEGKANSCTLFHSNIQPLMVELWSKIACTLILNNLFCLSCFNALKWAFYNHFCLIWHIEALDASYLASCCSMTLCIRFNNIISIKNISTNDNEVKVRNTTKRCCSKKGKIRRYHSNLGVSLLSRSDSITPCCYINYIWRLVMYKQHPLHGGSWWSSSLYYVIRPRAAYILYYMGKKFISWNWKNILRTEHFIIRDKPYSAVSDPGIKIHVVG